MIQVIDETKCTACNICVHACPTNVFEAVEGQIPRIARQDDCQTCFMCELYCPEDALYVSPQADASEDIDVALLRSNGAIGSYRRAIGWSGDGGAQRNGDLSFYLLGGGPR